MKPYKTIKLPPPSLADKFLRRQPQANCMMELENILADAESFQDLPDNLLQNLSVKYKIDIHEKHLERLKDIYSRLIYYSLTDEIIDEWEAEQVFRLQDVFGFPDNIHNDIYEKVAEKVYQRSLREALSDDVLTEEEKKRLEDLSRRLELPEEVKNKVTVEEAGGYLTGKMKKALSDGMLSPEEENEIEVLAENIGISLSYDAKTKSHLTKARLFWNIARGEPPVIDAGISLRKNEFCYFSAHVNWYEMRTVTKRIQYSGPQLRVKICKGLYWKMGDYAVNAVSEDVMKLIDTGGVFVTNKRIIFMGSKRNSSIALNKILDFSPHLDGVMIQKDIGKSSFIGLNYNQDVFCAVLARMISDTIA